MIPTRTRSSRYDARDDEQRRGTGAGRRQGGQQPTNPTIKAPNRPHEHVTSTACVCGALYHRSRYGIRWSDGVRAVREVAFAHGDSTGGTRPRTSILWAMRTIKLERWYCEHAACTPTDAPPF
jgi:hypothetical protein